MIGQYFIIISLLPPKFRNNISVSLFLCFVSLQIRFGKWLLFGGVRMEKIVHILCVLLCVKYQSCVELFRLTLDGSRGSSWFRECFGLNIVRGSMWNPHFPLFPSVPFKHKHIIHSHTHPQSSLHDQVHSRPRYVRCLFPLKNWPKVFAQIRMQIGFKSQAHCQHGHTKCNAIYCKMTGTKLFCSFFARIVFGRCKHRIRRWNR